MKVNPAMHDRTAQLINLVRHLDDEGPVEPVWADFRKQYYPDEDSYWEDFNLRFNDTEKPVDLYMDLIKILVETNQKGITGTKQEFATTLGTAPMRKHMRRQHVKNPGVLEQYRRKSKKEGKSTSSSSGDTNDDDSDESLGYRRSFGSQKEKQYRLGTLRRMMGFKNASSAPTLMRRSIRQQHVWNPEVLEQYRRNSKKKYRSTSSSDDSYYDHSNHRRTFGSQKDGTDRRILEVEKDLRQAKVSELNFKKVSSFEEETTYLRSVYAGKQGENQDVGNKNEEMDSPKRSVSWNKRDAWDITNNNRDKSKEKDKNKENSQDDKPLKTDSWEKQERGEKKTEKNGSKTKQKIHKWDLEEDMNKPKHDKISNWEQLSTTQNKINNNDKPKHIGDAFLESNKKDIWDSYGNKKMKEYDDGENVKKKENDEIKEKKGRENVGKIIWDDDSTQKKNKNYVKADLRSQIKSSEGHNIGRAIKDSWESKPKTKKDIWDNRITRGDYDNNLKKMSSPDKRKDNWDNKPKKRDIWKDERMKKYNSDGWDDTLAIKDSWNNKRKKVNRWNNESLKKEKSDRWNDEREKSTIRWRDHKIKRDWDPPPNREKKHDYDDYYERPRNKHAKRDRAMLNVRTPIPFVGKRGIYEEI